MTRLTGQDWLEATSTRAVIAALEAAGGAGCARFVGGCVRNALMGQPVDDIDIATTLKPEETEAAVRAAGLKAVPTGIAHGTVTAVAERRPFEITTLRRDVTTDGRNATVAFTGDWAEDAARRDFRLNALYSDADGQVFDPTGHGVSDAAEGRIVFVGDPETRIREDYLRILRFFRFFAWYGRGEPDAAGLAACAALADGMVRLSAERVSKELMKLLAAPDPCAAVAAMVGSGVLARVLPEAKGTDVFERVVERTSDPVLRLASLVPPDEATAVALAARLRLANAVRDRLVDLARVWDDVSPEMSPASARGAAWRGGRRAVTDALTLKAAGQTQDADALIALIDGWTPPPMPVGGREVARLGVEPGPNTGRILKAFEAEWIAEDFPPDGHEARLKRLVSAPRG